MEPRFQFTLRRVILSTTLIAMGMACVPLLQLVDDRALYAMCLTGLFVP
jgi:hypothetical protein